MMLTWPLFAILQTATITTEVHTFIPIIPGSGAHLTEGGNSSWFDLPREFDLSRKYTRSISGEFNSDGLTDVVLLAEGRLIFVAGPDLYRGSLDLSLNGAYTVNDMDFTPLAPSSSGGFYSVGPSGLELHWFDFVIGNFRRLPINSNQWLDARLVRWDTPVAGSPDLVLGVAADSFSVMGVWDPIGTSPTGELLFTASSPVRQIEFVNWSGDDDLEVAVMGRDKLSVWDLDGTKLAEFSTSAGVGNAFSVIDRSGASHQRLAWVTWEASYRFAELQVVGESFAEAPIYLGDLETIASAASDMDGDGSDELFLSHRTSREQVILLGLAVDGDELSASFSSGAFAVLNVLPGEGDSGAPPLTPFQALHPFIFPGFGNGGGTKPTPSQGPGAAGSGAGPKPMQPVGGSTPFLDGGFTADDPNLPGELPAPLSFSRNTSWPLMADLDGDGDVDIFYPLQPNGELMLFRNPQINENSLKVNVGGGTVSPHGIFQTQIKLDVFESLNAPAEATHLEVIVWRQDSIYHNVDPNLILREHIPLDQGFPSNVEVELPEGELVYPRLYHFLLREVKADASGIISEHYPGSVTTYTPLNEMYNYLKESNPSRGGLPVSFKVGGLQLGGTVPRPHLDPFNPGEIPYPLGGGFISISLF